MSASTVHSPRGVNACLRDVEAFANQLPAHTAGLVRRDIDDPLRMLKLRTPRLTVRVFERDYETLTDLIVAARRSDIPAVVDFEGSYLWVDLDFDGLIVRAFDYHTTCGARYALESLATCPIGDLDALLARVVEAREAGL